MDEVNNKGSESITFLQDRRHDFLKELSEYTGRNVIAYYSGWLTKSANADIDINDNDTNAFMQAIYKMDKTKGLDIILHTPGGDIAATESIVNYLHSIFGYNIRAIVPQMAMSAGTMIALSCGEIIMGKHSSLGPIDPQNRGISCFEALDEFDTAKKEVQENPSCLGIWQVLVSKYTPTFLISCKHAIEWSKSLAEQWVRDNKNISPEKIDGILSQFVEHTRSKSHNRHISKETCKDVGLNIFDLEDDERLQDLVLSLHHCYMITFDKTIIVKAVENHFGGCLFRIHNTTTSPKS